MSRAQNRQIHAFQNTEVARSRIEVRDTQAGQWGNPVRGVLGRAVSPRRRKELFNLVATENGLEDGQEWINSRRQGEPLGDEAGRRGRYPERTPVDDRIGRQEPLLGRETNPHRKKENGPTEAEHDATT